MLLAAVGHLVHDPVDVGGLHHFHEEVGARTEAAVQAYQKDRNSAVDGRITETLPGVWH
jgi:hypothetical protein